MLIYTEGIGNISKDDILRLYNSVNWTTYTKEPENLIKAIKNSTYVIICIENDKLIGLVRSLSDDSAIHYLQDILVDPEFQHQGIGRELLNRCLKRFEHVRSHVLLTDDDEKQKLFYESVGYTSIKPLKKTILNCYVRMPGMNLE
ncbi:MAG: GNAT family N-acetyltransferase [candidate division Zixibacteria bacterium]|nr:GNAT family N-acetyltransferase [candidate division Zixibacteria bacterium]